MKNIILKRFLISSITAVGAFASITTIWAFVSGRTALFDSKVTPELLKTPWLGVEVIQDGHPVDMKMEPKPDQRTVRATLRPEPFELRFPKKSSDDFFLVCAWTNSSIFSHSIATPDDGSTKQIKSCFCKGCVIADYPHGAATLYISNQASNAIVDERLGIKKEYNHIYYSSLYFMDEDKQVALKNFAKPLYVRIADANEGSEESLILDFK
ncbi:hypothetical protein EGT07_08635 [Herbaspirillum sp. HC18]|nr:hypothetical protein EGT07_08635 [Herbaspirillum sp. HC18]